MPGAVASFGAYLVDRYQFLKRAGLETFLGKRNVAEALGYIDKITPQDYRVRYERGGIAGRIVDVYPDATWRGDAEVIEDDKVRQTLTSFETEVKALIERLSLWSVFQRTDRLTGLGRYSVLLMGAVGELNTELPKGRDQKGILYVTPFGEEDAKIETWDLNPSSVRFGQPQTYLLKRMSLDTVLGTKPVHWSRVVHFSENPLEDLIYGRPRLERPWNRLDDLEKVVGGGAEAFWIRANAGQQWDMETPENAVEDPDALADMKKQADEYEHKMRRIIRTRNVTISQLGSDVADFSSNADAIMTQIAGMVGIPKRILTGSEMGQLASGQDRDNWDTQVSDRRLGFAEPWVVRPFVQRLIDYGYLPAPKQFKVRWPDMRNLSEEERAQGAERWSSVNQKNGTPVFTTDEIRDKWYGLEPLTEEQIQKIADDKETLSPIPPALDPANPDAEAEKVNLVKAAIARGDIEVVVR